MTRTSRIAEAVQWHEVRDESGKVVGRYAVQPYDSEAFHRAWRSEIDALDRGQAHPGTFALLTTGAPA